MTVYALAQICLASWSPPQSARLSCWGFGGAGQYGPLTLDYNERARGLTLAVSLWLQPQRNLKGVTKVCEHPLRWHVIQIGLIGQKLRPLLSYRSGRKSGGQTKDLHKTSKLDILRGAF